MAHHRTGIEITRRTIMPTETFLQQRLAAAEGSELRRGPPGIAAAGALCDSLSMATGDPIRLVVFDCDGTLVDSQHNIFAAMAAACGDCGYAEPPLAEVRSIVGLSLIEAVARLLPGASGAEHARVTEHYKQHFFRLRQSPAHHEPLFEGARACLDRLAAAGFLLGIATGKSRRGLDATLAAHGLGRYFVTLQTADRTPGKPSPVMLQQAMAETGADARRTIVVGDTTFDIEMGRNAGVTAVGVGWGYHPAAALRRAGAAALIERFEDLAALALQLTAGESPSARTVLPGG